MHISDTPLAYQGIPDSSKAQLSKYLRKSTYKESKGHGVSTLPVGLPGPSNRLVPQDRVERAHSTVLVDAHAPQGKVGRQVILECCRKTRKRIHQQNFNKETN